MPQKSTRSTKGFREHKFVLLGLFVATRLNPAATWDTRRFRPNFFIETEAQIKGLVEAEWEGRKLHVGSVELQCEIPTPRCGMTIQAQADLPKEPSILRTIVKDADQSLGIYASVLKPGEVKIGDLVELG